MSNQDILKDGRTPWFNVHSVFDESIPWSVDAYRVYGHLCRRVGSHGSTAFPSYSSIGKTCCQHDYKGKSQPSDKSLRSRAIRAMNELRELGMVSATARKSDLKGNQSNVYTLTHSSEWQLTPGDCQSPPQLSTITTLVIEGHHPSDCQSPISKSKGSKSNEGSPPIVPQATEQPGEVEVALLQTAEHETSGDGLGAKQASPVKRLEAVGEGECSAAAPHPKNFERMNYGKANCPIFEHYGIGYMAVAKERGKPIFSPRLIKGMMIRGKDWPGVNALTSDVRAIAHIWKQLSLLKQPQHYEAALALLELAWEEGAEAAPTQSRRLSQAEELSQRFAYYNQGAA